MILDAYKVAHIHPEAQIGKNVKILPFSYIDKDVIIGDNCEIGPNSTILSGSRIGKNCKIFPGAVIGAIPQDLKFNGEYTTVEIGDYTTIREHATINRGTKFNNKTSVGSNCLVMAYSHVAHDCMVGDHCILANCVNLAGHVIIEDYAILEGMAAVQQFVHIGAHAFITGGSLVRKNVPPYVKAAREPLSYVGVNTIGLQRRGYDTKDIQHIENIYRWLFVKGFNISNALRKIQEEIPPSKYREQIYNFVKTSNKGIMRGVNGLTS